MYMWQLGGQVCQWDVQLLQSIGRGAFGTFEQACMVGPPFYNYEGNAVHVD